MLRRANTPAGDPFRRWFTPAPDLAANPRRRHGMHLAFWAAMKTSNLLSIASAAAVLALSSCTTLEQVRLRSDAPSPAMDHCLACMDLGQAWALFRMGEYDQVESTCALVIEGEPNPATNHAFRARDL